MAHFPVTYRQACERGTGYLDHVTLCRIVEQHGRAGQAWRYRRTLTSYRPNSRVVYKNVDGLKVESEEDFWRVMTCCELHGVSPPSSFGDVFHQRYYSPIVRQSLKTPVWNCSSGGWQEAFQCGRITAPVWRYDLNQAYRWASSVPLPDMATIEPTRDFRLPSCFYLVYVEQGEIPYYHLDGIRIVTSEERDMFDLRLRRVLSGWRVTKWTSLEPVWAQMEACFPYCFRRIGKAFWGRWNTRHPVEQLSWKSGTLSQPVVRPLTNPLFNPVWSHYVTSRVKCRLAEHRAYALHVFVDSLLSLEPLPVSDGIGGWKVESEHPDGVTIYGPGQWGEGDYLVKHAGIKAGESGRVRWIKT